MKRPLGFVALLYAAGLLLAEWFQPPLWFLFALSLSVAVPAIAFARVRRLLIYPLVVLTGWSNLVYRTAIISPADLRALLNASPELVSVRGALVVTPDERVYLRDDQESFRTLACVDVSALGRNGSWRP